MQSFKNNPLYRLENNLWQVNKTPNKYDPIIRIKTPAFEKSPGDAYTIALSVFQMIDKCNLFSLNKLNQNNSFCVKGINDSLNGLWSFNKLEQNSFVHKLWQLIPMTHQVEDKDIVILDVIKTADSISDYYEKLFFSIDNHSLPNYIFQTQYDPNSSLIDRLKMEPFEDPFTKLSCDYLQTVETHFISEGSIRSDWHFMFDKGTLSIEPLYKEDKEINQITVKLYYEFLLSEYGSRHLDYLQTTYGYNFVEMFNKGRPLLPDHVYKSNIGVNYITLEDIQELYQKILIFIDDWKKSEKSLKLFSIRELREISRSVLFIDYLSDINSLTETLPQILKKMFGENLPQTTKELDSQFINFLVGILTVPRHYRNNIYTGRKIVHLPICGYQSTGSALDWDPVSNMSDLLHIYPEIPYPEMKGAKGKHWDEVMTKELDNFLELGAHVFSKKYNIGQFSIPNSKEFEARAGILIPAPLDINGKEQWYYMKTTYSNNGQFYIDLESACNHYRFNGKPLPFVRFYRSSTSDESYIDGKKYISEDLNPFGSPGSSDMTQHDPYSLPELDQHTLPLWAGYFAWLEKLVSESSDLSICTKIRLKTLQAFKIYVAQVEPKLRDAFIKEEPLAEKIDEKSDPEKIDSLLKKASIFFKERPIDKSGKDVILGGHSLGGPTAQIFFKHLLVDKNRIPLPGCHFICYSLNGPGTDQSAQDDFSKFIDLHEEMLSQINSQFYIHHRFQRGDIVPKTGECHLNKISKIVKLRVQVFKILEDTIDKFDLALKYMPVHGGRINQSIKGKSYKLIELSSKELDTFDHSRILDENLSQKFGLLTRTTLESARKILSIFAWPAVYFYSKEKGVGPDFKRDENGVFYLKY